MLIHRKFPSSAPLPADDTEGRRSVAGDAIADFMRATKPRLGTGANMGLTALLWGVRAVLWLDMQLFAATAIVIMSAIDWARSAVPLAIMATVIVLAKGVWKLILVPFHHVALTIVALGVAIEAALAGRVFMQLAYKDDVEGFGASLLSYTDTLVAPFRSMEGSTPLNHTGVVEFATLTAIEAFLVGTIAVVLLLTFWSEFLHMYRRIGGYFSERSERRNRQRMLAGEPEIDAVPVAVSTADLSAAS